MLTRFVRSMLSHVFCGHLTLLSHDSTRILVHRWIIRSVKVASTDLYTWIEKGTVTEKCLFY